MNALVTVGQFIGAFIGVGVAFGFSIPVALRLLNEITSRLVGRAVVICPHCGVPGVVRSDRPEVFR